MSKKKLKRKERDRFMHVFQRNYPRIPLSIAYKLVRLAIKNNRLAVYLCNGASREKFPFETWKDYDKAREKQMDWVEEEREKVKRKVEALSKEYAISELRKGVNIQFDPKVVEAFLRVLDREDKRQKENSKEKI